MKYKDFYNYLTLKTNQQTCIGSSISIKLNSNHISIKSWVPILINSRFIIFPLKIYGNNLRHLNVLILDRKTNIIERYEPFERYLNFNQINSLLEPLLYKLMEQRKIYFLKYQTTLNTKVRDDKNCCLYCLKYIIEKIKE